MPSSVVEEGFLLFVFHKLVNQIHDVDFKLSRSVWVGFSVISDSLNQFFFFACVLHNLLIFDTAKTIIFCVLCKYLGIKDGGEVPQWLVNGDYEIELNTEAATWACGAVSGRRSLGTFLFMGHKYNNMNRVGGGKVRRALVWVCSPLTLTGRAATSCPAWCMSMPGISR